MCVCVCVCVCVYACILLKTVECMRVYVRAYRYMHAYRVCAVAVCAQTNKFPGTRGVCVCVGGGGGGGGCARMRACVCYQYMHVYGVCALAVRCAHA